MSLLKDMPPSWIESRLPAIARIPPRTLCDFLHVEKGTLIDLAQMRAIQDRLWSSARFLRHTVAVIADKNHVGRCYLHIEVEEAAEAPSLNTPFSLLEQTVLKTSDWLSKLDESPEDEVFSLTYGDDDLRFVWGRNQGFAVTLAPTKAATQPAVSAPISLVMTPKEFGVVLAASRKKYVGRAISTHAVVAVNMVPAFDPRAGKSQQNIGADFGIDTTEDPAAPPLRLRIGVAPVAMILAAHPAKGTAQVKDGVLTITSPDQVLRIDSASGRLLQFNDIPHRSILTLSSAKGALDGEIKLLESAVPTNQADPNHFYGSLMGFLGDWLGASDYLSSKAAVAQRAAAASGVSKLLSSTLFAPVDELFKESAAAPADRFYLPVHPGLLEINGMYGQFARMGLPLGDEMFVRGSWPWTLTREFLNAYAGNGAYTNREIARLYGSTEIGPIGYLACAKLLTYVDPPLARSFAQKGLESLSPESFQKDCKVLILTNSVAARMMIQLVANARQLTDEEAKAVGGILDPALAAILIDIAQKKAGPEKATARAPRNICVISGNRASSRT